MTGIIAPDGFNKKWITKEALRVLEEYDGQITLRQLYYRIVAVGMTNDLNHYKRVISAMTTARWDGRVDNVLYGVRDFVYPVLVMGLDYSFKK